MSSATTKTATIKATQGDATVGNVTVERRDDVVVVEWITSCAVRRFALDDLASVMANLAIAEAYPDTWLHDTDSHGSPFYVRIVDGRIYGGDHAGDDVANAPWSQVKRAIAARAK